MKVYLGYRTIQARKNDPASSPFPTFPSTCSDVGASARFVFSSFCGRMIERRELQAGVLFFLCERCCQLTWLPVQRFIGIASGADPPPPFFKHKSACNCPTVVIGGREERPTGYHLFSTLETYTQYVHTSPIQPKNRSPIFALAPRKRRERERERENNDTIWYDE